MYPRYWSFFGIPQKFLRNNRNAIKSEYLKNYRYLHNTSSVYIEVNLIPFQMVEKLFSNVKQVIRYEFSKMKFNFFHVHQSCFVQKVCYKVFQKQLNLVSLKRKFNQLQNDVKLPKYDGPERIYQKNKILNSVEK